MNDFNTLTWMIESPVVLLVFVIVLVVCLRVLPEMGFDGFSRRVLAICVAALSAMGLLMFRPGRAPDGASEPWPDYFILLPYAALGLTLLLLPFILLIDWCFHIYEEHFRQKCKPSQRTKERHASPLPKPHIIGDGKDVRRMDCRDRQRVKGPDRDQLKSGKRRFRQ